jgi:hypothetical protein
MRKIFLFLLILLCIVGNSTLYAKEPLKDYLYKAEFIKKQIIREADAIIYQQADNEVVETILLDDIVSFQLFKLYLDRALDNVEGHLVILRDVWKYNHHSETYSYRVTFKQDDKYYFLDTVYAELSSGQKVVFFVLMNLDDTENLENDTTNLKQVDSIK